MRRDVRRDRAAGALPPRRVTVVGEVRPRSRRHRPAVHRRPRSGPVALPRAAARLRGRARRHPRRGDDPAAPGSPPRSRARPATTAGQGRRPAADRLLQGARRRRRRLPRQGAGRDPARHADQRQRGRGLVDVRRPGRPARHHRDAAGRAHDHPGGDRRHRRRPAAGRRADLRRRPADRRGGAGQRGRLVRGVDAQGALPDRGQEDDGAGDRRAAGVADARRDPLPDRRRGRSDRHPQGARRGPRAGLGRGRPAAARVRPGDRLRADRHGVRRRRRRSR